MYQDKTTLITCNKCNSQIFNQVFQIHKIMCNKTINHKKQPKPFSSIISSVFKQQKSQLDSKQMIPCLTCGQNISFNLYAIHQLECVGNQIIQCRYCDIKYPIYLIEEHNGVCQAKKQLQEIQQQINNQQEQKQKRQLIIQSNQNNNQNYLIDSSDDDESNNNNQQHIDLRMLISRLAIQQQQQQKQKQQGLTQIQIKNIRDHIVLKDQQCSICCTPMKKIQRNMILNCKHIYHRKCLTPWLLINPCCPLCRRHALKK